jgi:hypothetical protein
LYESKREQRLEILDENEKYHTDTQKSADLEEYSWEPPKDLAEILDLIEIRISEEFGLNSRVYIVKNRSYIFTDQIKTLDEIGQVFDITRERVRQIMAKVEDFKISDLKEIPALEQIVERAIECETEEEFIEWAENSEVTNHVPISIHRLKAICNIFEFYELEDRLTDKYWEIYETEQENNETNQKILNEILKRRKNHPIVDLNVVAKKFQKDIKEVQKIALLKYPRASFFEGWALAKTQNHDPEIIKNLYLILKYLPDTNLNQILVGLKRSNRNKAKAVIPDKVLRGLIAIEAGNPPSNKQLEKSLLTEPEISRYDKWLLDLFLKSESGVLHGSEVITAGVANEYPIGSVSKYLNDCPFLYKPELGMYALLNVQVPESFVQMHKQIVLSAQEKTKIEYEFVQDLIKVKVKPNSSTLSGGVLFPDRALAEMIRDFAFEFRCTCGKLESKSKATYTKNAFWKSFSPLTNHLRKHGDFELGDAYTFFLDFNNLTATLEHPGK